jgi:hypothetical protein
MQDEKYGFRNRSYSAWHRTNSLSRFLPREIAETIHMIDSDGILWWEFDHRTSRPLAFVETAIYRGERQMKKQTIVTATVGEMSHLPAYLVLYSLADRPNPFDPGCQDIDLFRVCRKYPDPDENCQILTPQEYAQRLIRMRNFGFRLGNGRRK